MHEKMIRPIFDPIQYSKKNPISVNSNDLESVVILRVQASTAWSTTTKVSSTLKLLKQYLIHLYEGRHCELFHIHLNERAAAETPPASLGPTAAVPPWRRLALGGHLCSNTRDWWQPSRAFSVFNCTFTFVAGYFNRVEIIKAGLQYKLMTSNGFSPHFQHSGWIVHDQRDLHVLLSGMAGVVVGGVK